MNNRGFTLIEILGVIIILSILLTIASLGYTNYINNSRDKAFRIAVNSFIDATQAALEDCEVNRINSFCTKYEGIPEIGEKITIELEDLVNNGYIDPIRSPYGTEKICEGTITVERKEGEIFHNEESLGVDNSNIELEYETCLKCGTHQTDECE